MKGKTFLANRYYLTYGGIIYIPLLIIFIVVMIIRAVTTIEQDILPLIILMIFLSIVCFYIFLIPGTATMRFYEEYFRYKKNLFAKPILFPYSEITKLFVDFGCGSPPPMTKREWVKRKGYIYSSHELVCCFCLNRSILKECLKHVGKSKVKVDFSVDTFTKKLYFPILEEYLTEKQKREMKSK